MQEQENSHPPHKQKASIQSPQCSERPGTNRMTQDASSSLSCYGESASGSQMTHHEAMRCLRAIHPDSTPISDGATSLHGTCVDSSPHEFREMNHLCLLQYVENVKQR